jgi:hypothetical protein
MGGSAAFEGAFNYVAIFQNINDANRVGWGRFESCGTWVLLEE